ncbi:MAG: hypothetical protein LBJ58_04875 [Tannerellaceae bacterium]|jgi:hypothetical protein|nr:hypothetical protein [Tannerellaceae bacterium]
MSTPLPAIAVRKHGVSVEYPYRVFEELPKRVDGFAKAFECKAKAFECKAGAIVEKGLSKVLCKQALLFFS